MTPRGSTAVSYGSKTGCSVPYQAGASRWKCSRGRNELRTHFLGDLFKSIRNDADVLFAGGFLFVVGLDPVFPVLAGGAVFAGEFEAGDLGIADLALVCCRGREVVDPGIGESRTGLAVEDESFDTVAVLQGEGYVAAIVEGLVE